MKSSEQTPLVDLPTPPDGLDEDYEVIRTATEESPKDKPKARRLPIPNSEFTKFVESNRLTDMFSEEFLTLARICPAPPALLIRTGLEKGNRSKSRNANSHPFDRNRVILESEGSSGSNFIDASYVKGNRYRFITTQMPMPNTVADIWDVVFYNQPSVIIMLNDVDRRDLSCAQYWLDDGVATFGSFSVTTLSVSEKGGLIERQMEVTRNKSKTCHLVKQYQFLDWPTEAGQQENRALQLINLMAKVEDAFKRTPEGFPVLVHCINGVGRTGVFCSTLECIAQVNEEGAVDVFKVVKMLRNKRMHFVQTKEEYLFVYELIKEYLRHVDNHIQALP
nr:receptor-type tyrosine-protein phosphatase S-like [Lytechinus pictus]